MSDEYVSRDYLLGEYDRQHQGPPGGARKIIAGAPAADVVERPRWIPVTERLPEKDGDYLCWLLGYRRVLRWDGKDWWYVSIGDAYTRHVTHWQILPEPPEDMP